MRAPFGYYGDGRAYWYIDCDVCDGFGEMICPMCKEPGRPECLRCKGTGEVDCERCEAGLLKVTTEPEDWRKVYGRDEESGDVGAGQGRDAADPHPGAGG